MNYEHHSEQMDALRQDFQSVLDDVKIQCPSFSEAIDRAGLSFEHQVICWHIFKKGIEKGKDASK